ncbi:MAG: hypothetical protein HY262_09535 [Chloroflexi bacterium]|nr:hypothetical protein [Chloroflexota bacterium]
MATGARFSELDVLLDRPGDELNPPAHCRSDRFGECEDERIGLADLPERA